MTKLSSSEVKPQRMTQLYNDLWSAIALLETKQEAKEFLHDLLTQTERKMLAKRFQVALLLVKGMNYQSIRSSLKVTDVTIAKVNNWLKGGATGLIKVLQRLIELKKKKLKETIMGKGKYIAGDLLVPALEESKGLISRKFKSWRKVRSVQQD